MATVANDLIDRPEQGHVEVGDDGGRAARSRPVKARKHLTPEEKYRIFLETQRGDVSVATVLRKYGIHSSDLTRIRAQVREGALESLAQGNRKGRRPKDSAEVAALKAERARVEEALKELAIENTLLRKKVS